MVTGIECVGLVLAVIPLVIELAGEYRGGIGVTRDILQQKRHQRQREYFQMRLRWVLQELRHKLKVLIDAVPSLKVENKVELAENAISSEWGPKSDIHTALSVYLRPESMGLLTEIMEELVFLIGQLLSGVKLSMGRKADLSQTEMLDNIKRFIETRGMPATSDTLSERFIFRLKRKDHEKCLAQLDDWDHKLGKLVERATCEIASKGILTAGASHISSALRQISCKLHRALSIYWRCSCPMKHEARICLRMQRDLHHAPNLEELEVDILISVPNAEPASLKEYLWQEGILLFENRSPRVQFAGAQNPLQLDGDRITKVCDALMAPRSHEQSTKVLITEDGSQHKLWHLRSQPKKFQYPASNEATKLSDIWGAHHRFKLQQKRRLALLFAYNLLQLCESPWAAQGISKEQILFFSHSIHELDMENPFISTCFDPHVTNQVAFDASCLHKNSSILSLGILLLELDRERPIEIYRRDPDLGCDDQVDANTDLKTAERLVEELEDDCSNTYLGAVKACLHPPWVFPDERVSLEDEKTRAGIAQFILSPLEEELRYLFREIK